MKIHNLKSLSEYFRAVWQGDKNFEIRKNDRDYKVGDFIILQEWTKGTHDWASDPLRYREPEWAYTGEIIIARITYVTEFEQKKNYVVFGMRVIERKRLTRGDDPLLAVSSTEGSYPCR